jgi:cysteine-S-conjugate beta-lyase
MKRDSILTAAGRDPAAHHGIVNPPVYHASTVLFPTLAALEAASARTPGHTYYGRAGTPTTFAMEDAVCAIEGGYRTLAVGSGVAALTTSLMAFLSTGDEVLVADCVYGPVRKFCDSTLKRLGVTTRYFDPAVGGAIAAMFGARTRVVMLEAPGSLTFEMQDVPAIAAACRRAGVISIIDNTWATPYFFRPLDHGVDVSIQSATKYLAGHSDLMMGTITATREAYDPLRRTVHELGACAAPDDCYLALRGMRTLGVRLPRHQETGLALARWLGAQPEVTSIRHPAWPDDPGHALWRRDFTGATGLFAFTLKDNVPRHALAAMVDDMRLFGMGYSWGGFESLILPTDPAPLRTARPWTGGQLVRVHAGLEDRDDLIADLADGFTRMRAATATRPPS